ncbi:FAD-binding oxidoreductase [Ornithinicoccus halotolerans]|uniref:FAD-binding oxidoreductase n=1 Tax=Ornithinicoccus halotolerans TaxID=1748220 RepID=UPI001297EBEB|nr:FAD-binding oxidoreductase [Ornithinicoccus halotolerans]
MELADILGGACPVRQAGPGDDVDGVMPRVVATPGSTEQTAALLRTCHQHRLAVTTRGRGTRLSWGRPPRRLDVVLETTAMDRLVEHAHGDLIATAQAGLPLADLQAVLAEAGQQLLVDDLVGGGTVGGLVATNACGPRRLVPGAPRDLLIGVTMVRADGTVAKAGGKVVKNVAGYDLGKLLCGSYGTLGVVTEATFRLHPLPEATSWVEADVPMAELAGRVAAVRHSQLVPSALEVDAAPADGDGTAADRARVAVMLAGTAGGVRARTESVRGLLGAGAQQTDPRWPFRLPGDDRTAPRTSQEPADRPVLLRMTAALSAVPELVRHATAASVAVRGSAGVGVLHGRLRGSTDPADVADRVQRLRRWCTAHGGSLVVLDAAPHLKQAVDSWGPVGGLPLMRRVKHEFDPAGVLSPGRFVGGI